MGSRMNDTTPMKNSTTNSTTGVTGWRIAHADMFLMNEAARESGGCGLLRIGHAYFLADAQERAGGRDDAFVAVETCADHEPLGNRVGDAHSATLGRVVAADDEHVRALRIREHRRLRQDRALSRAGRHFCTRECTRPNLRVGRERDANLAESRLRIDDRAEQAHLAGERLVDAREKDLRALVDG